MVKCLSAAAAAKSLQLCPTLCDPIDDSPAGSPVPGILQARTLEWVAISFSKSVCLQCGDIWVLALGWEDPLEKEMAIDSSTIACKIPWAEDPGRLQSMGSQRVGQD